MCRVPGKSKLTKSILYKKYLRVRTNATLRGGPLVSSHTYNYISFPFCVFTHLYIHTEIYNSSSHATGKMRLVKIRILVVTVNGFHQVNLQMVLHKISHLWEKNRH
ncbi:hypothetical protein AQUCO_04200057v1 [Aquilegia coerulea]|uniref:Uncharacterized protein n=1 Tax=Aquilegia coerulea TaxID=218851 RepID=A0A2G5CP23_AQUCA|nr:hypothetical protein AQUCO_04200057v1 [Aquilegia coerulea]